VFVAAWVGDRLVHVASRGRTGHPSVFLALVVGSAVLVLLFAIPYIGWLVRLIAVLVGFGALWVTVWSAIAARHATAPVPQTPA